MQPTPQRLGHYEILAKLGEGGMGVVYKARDVNLQRPVAIKVLPHEWVADADRKRRFIQEAQAASALNHPAIVTIHEIAQHDGMDFIAMEFVQGKTLAELIGRKGLRLRDALTYAIQAAGALAKAHATGIVHRDLKPSNIMVTDDGLVKILDFGVAKLLNPTEPGDDSQVETRTVKPNDVLETAPGKIVGTVAYMSPEQAEGRKVDARSDIFSFGAVLYEMVTGVRTFQGSSSAQTLSAVLNAEPKPPSELRRDLPRDLERVILKSLKKDPARRYQVIADLAVDLDEIKTESGTGVAAAAAPPRAPFLPWPAVAGVAVILAVAASVWLWRTEGTAPSTLNIGPLTAFPGDERYPSLSPDGNQVAFSWTGEKGDNEDIYLMSVGGETPLRLTTDPAPDQRPVWSPDGRRIAFLRPDAGGFAIYVATPPAPNSEKKITTVAQVLGPSAFTTQLSWFADGRLAITAGDAAAGMNGIVVIPSDGGEPVRIAWRPTSEGIFRLSAVSPASAAIAYAFCTANFTCHAYAADLDAGLALRGTPRRLTTKAQIASGVAWTPDGRSVILGLQADYLSSLWRAAADGSSLERIDLAGERATSPSISKQGNLLAFQRGTSNPDLRKFVVGRQGGEAIASSQRYDATPQFSPDGMRIVFESNRLGRLQLFIASADGSNSRQLTEPEEGGQGSASWSPNGQWVAYDEQLPNGRPQGVFVISADGTQQHMVTSPGAVPSWSHDGSSIYFSRGGGIWRTPATRDNPVLVVPNANAAMESADGQTLYYRKAGTPGLFARPVAGGSETQVLTSVAPGVHVFMPIQEGVYYVSVPQPGEQREIRFFEFASRRETVLFHVETAGGSGLSVSPDRSTILFSGSNPADGDDLMLIRNFR